ncbi:unnamed protein product [Symbiodinium natans]|uniref:Uncharacterized protein n=1 Tax=Symbiodinium natans TaxID=878477 RepID=A0A812HUT8_9DINO|nr:unnamed protein product [Symbiodinium natans]
MLEDASLAEVTQLKEVTRWMRRHRIDGKKEKARTFAFEKPSGTKSFKAKCDIAELELRFPDGRYAEASLRGTWVWTCDSAEMLRCTLNVRDGNRWDGKDQLKIKITWISEPRQVPWRNKCVLLYTGDKSNEAYIEQKNPHILYAITPCNADLSDMHFTLSDLHIDMSIGRIASVAFPRVGWIRRWIPPGFTFEPTACALELQRFHLLGRYRHGYHGTHPLFARGIAAEGPKTPSERKVEPREGHIPRTSRIAGVPNYSDAFFASPSYKQAMCPSYGQDTKRIGGRWCVGTGSCDVEAGTALICVVLVLIQEAALTENGGKLTFPGTMPGWKHSDKDVKAEDLEYRVANPCNDNILVLGILYRRVRLDDLKALADPETR